MFLNGVASDLAAVTRSQRDCGFAVIYYNVKSKTIWAYTTSGWDDDDAENSSYILLKGEVKSIYYQSTDVITPTSIELEVDLNDSSDSELIDSDGNITVALDSSELQYVFSIYGDIQAVSYTHLFSVFLIFDFLDFPLQVGIDGKNFLGRLDVFFACVGQGEGVGGTVENRSSQIAFYQFDHLTEGGLGNIKLFGGACDAAFLINGKHVLSVFGIHKTS